MSDPTEFDDHDQYPDIPPPIAKGQPIVVEVLDGDDRVLEYTQLKRQQIITEMMGASGEKLANLERGDKMVLLQALDGMDRSALGKKRLKTDEKVATSQAAVAALVAKVLTTPGIGQAGLSLDAHNRIIPTLPSYIPEPILVPGEIATDAPQMDIDSFMAQSFGKNVDHVDN